MDLRPFFVFAVVVSLVFVSGCISSENRPDEVKATTTIAGEKPTTSQLKASGEGGQTTTASAGKASTTVPKTGGRASEPLTSIESGSSGVSLQDVFSGIGSYKCDITLSTSDGKRRMELWAKGSSRTRMETVIEDKKTVVIYNRDVMYIYYPEDNMAIKINVNKKQVASNVKGANTLEDVKSAPKTDYRCYAADVSDDMFTLPQGVQVTDLSSL